jgi:hypothetical protein
MKNVILLFFLVIVSKFSTAQFVVAEAEKDPFNFVLLIDGQLAGNGIGVATFNLDNKKYCCFFDYYRGLIKVLDNPSNYPDYEYLMDSILAENTIYLKEDDISIFKIIPESSFINIYIVGYAKVSNKNQRIIYKHKENAELFSILNVLTITNFNETYDNYYIGAIYGGCIVSGIIWDKKYGNIDEFYKKTLRGIENIPIIRAKP